MPDGTPASAPGQPAQPQPPFGNTPATQPTPNRGHEAAGMQKLGVALQALQEALPMLGAGSEPWKKINKIVDDLAKLVPSGTMSPAVNRNQLEQTALKQGQNNQQMQMLRQMQAKQGQSQQPAAA